MKFWFLVSLFFVITTTYSQSVLEKKVNLPKLVRKIAAPDKENFVLSPDGTILCIIRPASLYNVLLMNMGDGAITDSIAVNSYAPLMKWSADSRTLLFYTEEYPRSQFTLYNRKGEVLKKIETPYPVLNFGVDSTATEIVATVYDLPESGAVYKSDLTTAFIYPKGKKYTYKI